MERPIPVICIALPDGTTLWADNANQEYVQDCIKAWKERLSPETLRKYEESGVLGGFIELRMLPEDFKRIPATNSITWPTPNVELTGTEQRAGKPD